MNEILPEKNYRQKRSQLHIGIGYFVCFLLITIIFTASAYWNIDGSFRYPKQQALIHGLFWSGWTILCIWNLLAYYREHLTISAETIVKHYVLRKKVIAIEEILCIKWPRQGRLKAILLESPFAKIRIYLSEYTKAEQDEIIHFLHTTVGDDLQENWSKFKENYHRIQVNAPPSPPTAKDLILTALILLILAGCFIYYWSMGMGVKNLVFGLVTSVIAIWYLARLRHLSVQDQCENQKMGTRA